MVEHLMRDKLSSGCNEEVKEVKEVKPVKNVVGGRGAGLVGQSAGLHWDLLLLQQYHKQDDPTGAG